MVEWKNVDQGLGAENPWKCSSNSAEEMEILSHPTTAGHQECRDSHDKWGSNSCLVSFTELWGLSKTLNVKLPPEKHDKPCIDAKPYLDYY